MNLKIIAGMATAAVLGLGIASASAMELVAGGYGAEVGSLAPPAALSLDVREFTSSASSAGFTLDFTPRASGSLFGPSTALDDRSMSISLGVQEGYGERLRLGAIGLGDADRLSRIGGFASDADISSGLALGGAFNLNEWQVTGSVGRASLLGESADLFAAGIGYGPLNARLVYGHVPRTTGTTGDLLMLSTDLAAWSWLTLEGDVAVSDTLVDEPLTVGRIGVRLNF